MAQKTIDQICFGEDCEAFKAFRKVQDRAKREHANLNAAGVMVAQSAEALQEAKESYWCARMNRCAAPHRSAKL